MGILIDTDVLIQGEKGFFDVPLWIAGQPEEDFQIAAITVAELWHGVERAAENFKHRRMEYISRVFASFPIISYTEEIAIEHARIWAKTESMGKPVNPHDLLVAATALHLGSAVATFNRRHFENIPGLKIIEPK